MMINWHSFFFALFALLACVFGAAVLFSGNIVRMAFYLVLSLGATSGLFFLAGAEFVGAMQLMIYVGGTLVLLIFGVMLTAQEAFVSMRTRSGEWVVGVILGSMLLAILLITAFSVEQWSRPSPQWTLSRVAQRMTDLIASEAEFVGEAEGLAVAERIDTARVQRLVRLGRANATACRQVEDELDRIAASHSTGPKQREIAHRVGEIVSRLSTDVDVVLARRETRLEALRARVDEEQALQEEADADLHRSAESVAQTGRAITAALSRSSRALRPLLATVADSKETTRIGGAFAGIRVDRLEEPDQVLRRGMSGYLLPFVIVSVHLLVVLIGAAYMARPKRRETAPATQE